MGLVGEWLVGDRSRLFAAGLAAAWLAVVALPITLSAATGQSAFALPLLGVVLWFVSLRAARVLSPAARADAHIRHGRYEEALALSDQALAVEGGGAWTGTRRLVWLNRRTAALLGLGHPAAALGVGLLALAISADPETLGNCAVALVRLNRYEEAAGAARLALALTRERSVSANATLATVMLARGMPAEAEALARAGLVDVEALLPLVRREHHVACLAALCRAEQAQEHKQVVRDVLGQLRQATRTVPQLRAVALVAEVDALPDTPEGRTRAFKLLADALDLDRNYVLWYVAQPGTFVSLRDDPRFADAREASAKELARLNNAAPDLQRVTLVLAAAQKEARPRPAPQASHGALVVQILTLSGTLLLLLWWSWRFFVVGA
jgi:tetratricopeptide (TPR) repeat protein